MNYIDYLFATIKLMFLQVIFVESAVIKMIIMPEGIMEHLEVARSLEVYLEHIAVAIVFISLGALIFIGKADFFVQNQQE